MECLINASVSVMVYKLPSVLNTVIYISEKALYSVFRAAVVFGVAAVWWKALYCALPCFTVANTAALSSLLWCISRIYESFFISKHSHWRARLFLWNRVRAVCLMLNNGMDLHSATLSTFWLWVWFNRANHSSVSLKSVGSGVVWLAGVRGLLTGKAISISDKRECCKCCGRRISRIQPGRPSVPVLCESLIDPGGIIERANVSFEAFEKRVWW